MKAKKRYKGKVISNKMNRTVVVEVSKKFRHPLYKKFTERRKKFYADTGEKTIAEGSEVTIIQSRPFSKLKRWQVIEVMEGAKE